MKEKNIQELAKRMGLVTVEDMCQYTIAQLVVKIANKVNELVNEVWRFESDVQEILKTQNENIQYLLGEGLHLEVENIFDGWVQDGTFDTLINQTALKKVNDRIDETNAQLSDMLQFKNEYFLTISDNLFEDARYMTSWDYNDLIEKYDELLNKFPSRVSKKALNSDSLGNVIYSYEFIPKCPKSKVILTAGIHGREKTFIFGLYLLMKKLCEQYPQNNALLKVMAEDIHFVTIPCVNPYGFNGNEYRNPNGININRNFPCRWKRYNPNNESNPAYQQKGSKPFSEMETTAVKELIETNKDATFMIDLHNTENHEADFYVIEVWDSPNINVIRKVLNYYVAKREATKEKYNLPNSKGVTQQNAYTTPTVAPWVWSKHNIPACCIEWEDKQYGEMYSQIEMNKALEWLCNHILQQHFFFKDKKKDYYFEASYLEETGCINERNKVLDNINSVMDSLIKKYPTYVTKESLGKDASGLYDVLCYTLTPRQQDRTVFILGGERGTATNTVYSCLLMLKDICENRDGRWTELKNNTKIVAIPCLNPWGAMQDVKSITNYAGQSLEINSDAVEYTLLKNKVNSITDLVALVNINNNVSNYNYQVHAPFHGRGINVAKVVKDRISNESESLNVSSALVENETVDYFFNTKKIETIKLFVNTTSWYENEWSAVQNAKNNEFFIHIIDELTRYGFARDNGFTKYIGHNTSGAITVNSSTPVEIDAYSTIVTPQQCGYIKYSGHIIFVNGVEGDIVTVIPVVSQGEIDIEWYETRFSSYTDLQGRVCVPFECIMNVEGKVTTNITMYIKCSNPSTSNKACYLQRLRSKIEFVPNKSIDIAMRYNDTPISY